MSSRIEIELTSARPDGTFTWRAAGAREPKGVVESTVLPDSSKVGDVLKVDAEFELDGISILGVVTSGRSRKEPTLIELIPRESSFEPVTQTLAKRDRSDRGDRGDRPRRDRSDRPRRDDDRRGPRPAGDGPPRDRDRSGPRPEGGGDRSDRPRREPRPDRPSRPRFEAPPELPQRPRPKRLKPGKAHRNAVMADLSDAQRPIAEKALQGGIPAVRQAVNEQNAALRADGKEEVPAAGLLKMAEELLPRLRVAEWLDRADAAKADLEELDLRDLRSVVAAADDPMVARDESTRELASDLKAALLTKQEKAFQEWLEDIGMALGVGRVIRALKLSSEPPKAGIRFPADLAQQLSTAATASLTPDATADRWAAVIEAVAFSPVRTHVTPAAPPTSVSDDLTAAVTRLAPLVPQIAAVFGITPAPGAPMPKPQRAPRKPDRKPERKPGAGPSGGQRPPGQKQDAPGQKQDAPGQKREAPHQKKDAPPAETTSAAAGAATATVEPAEARSEAPAVATEAAVVDTPAAETSETSEAPQVAPEPAGTAPVEPATDTADAGEPASDTAEPAAEPDTTATEVATESPDDDTAEVTAPEPVQDDTAEVTAPEPVQDDTAEVTAPEPVQDDTAEVTAPEPVQDDTAEVTAPEPVQDDTAEVTAPEPVQDDTAEVTAPEPLQDDTAEIAAPSDTDT